MKNTQNTYDEIMNMIAQRGDNCDLQYILEALHVIANNAAGDIRDPSRIYLIAGVLNAWGGEIDGPGDVNAWFQPVPIRID